MIETTSPILLDALLSYDLDNPKGSVSGMTFRWECEVLIGTAGCPFESLNNTSGRLTIHPTNVKWTNGTVFRSFFE